MDLFKVERALRYALGCSLGKNLKPKFHRGDENSDDVEAVATLHELRIHLGFKNGLPPVTVAVTTTLEDWSAPVKAPQY